VNAGLQTSRFTPVQAFVNTTRVIFFWAHNYYRSLREGLVNSQPPSTRFCLTPSPIPIHGIPHPLTRWISNTWSDNLNFTEIASYYYLHSKYNCLSSVTLLWIIRNQPFIFERRPPRAAVQMINISPTLLLHCIHNKQTHSSTTSQPSANIESSPVWDISWIIMKFAYVLVYYFSICRSGE